MQRLLILHLSLIDGVGSGIITRLLQSDHFADLYAFGVQEMAVKCGINLELASKIVHGLKGIEILEQEVQLMQKHCVEWTSVIDEDYPELLKHINGPPSVLYYRGTPLNRFEKNIAIIGSRKANYYGQQVIDACVSTLVQKGWNIISGGAIGADTIAHKQTVACAGNTVAILGSGLLHLYPRSNTRLFQEIIDCGGSVVSPFALQKTAHPGHFPARNRIISGMSEACLVVQAAQKSGALITAEYALQQGKSVFAVPGSIFDPLSAGCHALIKEGATPMLSVDDLMRELGETEVQQSLPLVSLKKVAQTKQTKVKPVLQAATTIDEKILFHCAREPLCADDLLVHIDIDIDQLNNYLFDLQLSGKVMQNAVGLWQLK
ncbi:MAG: DNA-processing protein DprA [Candidatus Dependentiae bacterium]